MQPVEKFIREAIEISNKSYDAFYSILSPIEFPKNHIIVKAGEVHNQFYLLENGVACSQTTDQNGNKHIRTLFTPVTVVTNIPSLVFKTQCDTEFTCITDCKLLAGDFKDFDKLINERHDVALSYARFLIKSYANLEDKNTELATLSSEERYLKLRKQLPDLENLIPLYNIAAYLNITPIQLSRIRKKVFST